MYFVLVYDRRARGILVRRQYIRERRDEALRERERLVLEYREAADIEVVLLGADSFEDLKKTHARYFESAEQLTAPR